MSSSEGSTVVFRRAPAKLRRQTIRQFALQLQNEVAQGRAFDTLITGDAELRRLNREFRGLDYATDVLSFTVGGTDCSVRSAQKTRSRTAVTASGQTALPTRRKMRASGQSSLSLGDLAISLGRARAQAREFGHTVEEEIEILMLHGVLHLLGHDHETDGGRMARVEKRWRARLGLPNGLIERARA